MLGNNSINMTILAKVFECNLEFLIYLSLCNMLNIVDKNNIGSNGCKILAKAGMTLIEHLDLSISIIIIKTNAELVTKGSNI